MCTFSVLFRHLFAENHVRIMAHSHPAQALAGSREHAPWERLGEYGHPTARDAPAEPSNVRVCHETMAGDEKCAHPARNCFATKGSKYCSQYCEDAGKTLELACNCGHAGCAEELTHRA
jgi:hypothetical protein